MERDSFRLSDNSDEAFSWCGSLASRLQADWTTNGDEYPGLIRQVVAAKVRSTRSAIVRTLATIAALPRSSATARFQFSIRRAHRGRKDGPVTLETLVAVCQEYEITVRPNAISRTGVASAAHSRADSKRGVSA